MRERRVIAVEGTVQGVGYRPFVHRLATAHTLSGFVRNDAGGVFIDVEGEPRRLHEFCRSLASAPPPLARVTRLRVATAPPLRHDGFRIVPSELAASATAAEWTVVPADTATCERCRSELFDPHDRRFGHPFITCTDCGPRFTIVTGTPFDRQRTTMAHFAPCARCRQEYDDPADRRFHAESISCRDCGPVLVARDPASDGPVSRGDDALDRAAAALLSGEIVALQALGGFHLACDATDGAAVARLRARKHRPTRPFAVMVASAEEAGALGELSCEERELLGSPARPVLLLRRRSRGPVAEGVAPGGDLLGLMLPSTPVHHLLLARCARPLVMTSGNPTGEPVVTDSARAAAELGGIADLLLVHDRPIAARCDDSVVRVIAGAGRLLRRARGHVPDTVPLGVGVPRPILAFGAHLKNTVCLAHGTAARLSAHVGDLDTPGARVALREAVEGVLRLAGVRPQAVAHDLHPDYASTTAARDYAHEHGIARRVAVQHHHAHVAACVAEHGVRDPVIGVVFDGAGLGSDGAIWGGEFLVARGAEFSRHGHLAYVPLPGGDAAARRPWRSAAAHLAGAGVDARTVDALRPAAVGEHEWSAVRHLVQRGAHSPPTSSVGRLFDAVASLLDLCQEATFEGEAAIALEAAAARGGAEGYAVALCGESPWTVDAGAIVRGVVADVARSRDRGEISAAFHMSLRDAIVAGCERVREHTGLESVVLTGGVFANALLTDSAQSTLVAHGFRVLLPRRVPCNDGGLALGQAWVAAHALQEAPCA